MKKLLLLPVLVLASIVVAKAQTSYGVKAGLNMAKVSMSGGGVSESTDSKASFYVTAFADIPVAMNLSVQPGVSLQGKGGKMALSDLGGSGGDVKMDLMFIEVPVNFVYYIPTADIGSVFLGAGPYAAFGLNAKSKGAGVEKSGSFSDNGLNAFDAGINVLAGYKLTNGFLINLGYGLGLTNMVKDSGDLSSKNRVFSVGVGFQF